MIKEALQQINAAQRRQLMYAFNEELPQYVELGDGHFLGVHVEQLPHLTILETAGAWSYGEIRSSSV